jgi:transposase
LWWEVRKDRENQGLEKDTMAFLLPERRAHPPSSFFAIEKNESSVFEKLIAAQLDVPLETLRSQMLIEPAWGVKKNSEGKNVFWYGFKGHLAIGTKSQYILQSIMSSGSLNDGKAAIPLLKGLQKLPLSVRYDIMDARYDSVPIYQQIYRMEAHSILAYNKRNEGETLGFDPLAQDSFCQKIYKIQIETDIRRYTAPARGTKKWEELYDQRTAIERVAAYLKEFFQLNHVRYRTGKKAKFHFDLVTLVYNASKLAADRIGKELKKTQTQAAYLFKNHDFPLGEVYLLFEKAIMKLIPFFKGKQGFS